MTRSLSVDKLALVRWGQLLGQWAWFSSCDSFRLSLLPRSQQVMGVMEPGRNPGILWPVALDSSVDCSADVKLTHTACSMLKIVQK